MINEIVGMGIGSVVILPFQATNILMDEYKEYEEQTYRLLDSSLSRLRRRLENDVNKSPVTSAKVGKNLGVYRRHVRVEWLYVLNCGFENWHKVIAPLRYFRFKPACESYRPESLAAMSVYISENGVGPKKKSNLDLYMPFLDYLYHIQRPVFIPYPEKKIVIQRVSNRVYTSYRLSNSKFQEIIRRVRSGDWFFVQFKDSPISPVVVCDLNQVTKLAPRCPTCMCDFNVLTPQRRMDKMCMFKTRFRQVNKKRLISVNSYSRFIIETWEFNQSKFLLKVCFDGSIRMEVLLLIDKDIYELIHRILLTV